MMFTAWTRGSSIHLPASRAAADALGLAAASVLVPTSSNATVWLCAVSFWSVAQLTEWPSFSLRSMVEAPTLFRRLGLMCALLIPFAAFLGATTTLVWHLALSVVCMSVSRAALYHFIRSGRRRGGGLRDVVVVGTGPEVDEFLYTVGEHPELGIRPVPLGQHRPLRTTDLRLVSEADAATVAYDTFVVFPSGAGGPVDSAHIWELSSDGNTVYMPVIGAAAGIIDPSRFEDIWGLPLARVSQGRDQRTQTAIKRSCEVGLSVLLLVAFLPILICAALGVRMSSEGPVLFRQMRNSGDRQGFEVLKFRTLPVQDREGISCPEDYTLRTGRVLRGSCIDELPQLINVLRGDMSVIGPRPELADIAAQLRANPRLPGYTARGRARPGMTGWAQAHQLRGETSLVERVRFDNLYIERFSLWSDLSVIPGTLTAIAAGITNRGPAETPTAERPDDITPRSVLDRKAS